MIQLTRLNSQAFALNTDLIERIEETPDTVLTLIDGTRYVVQEPVDDVIDRVVTFRARVVERATEDFAGGTPCDPRPRDRGKRGLTWIR